MYSIVFTPFQQGLLIKSTNEYLSFVDVKTSGPLVAAIKLFTALDNKQYSTN